MKETHEILFLENETEDVVSYEKTVRDEINYLAPQIQQWIIEKHGDFQTYVNYIEDKKLACRLFDAIFDRPWREQKAILLRFGLVNGDPKTLEEVAKIMGVSKERIRQIESKCLAPCRPRSRSKRLIEYLDENEGYPF